MADWLPLSSVPALAQALAPLPRAPRAAARPALEAEARAAPARPPPKEAEVQWKPAAASALAALANAEISSIKPEPAKAEPSLVDKMNIPEGGVDPTGMMPLRLRGVEPTGESQLGKRPPPVESTEVRQLRKSTNRRLLAVLVAMVGVTAGGLGAMWFAMGGKSLFSRAPFAVAPPAAPVPAVAPQPAPPPPPAAPASAPAGAAPQAAQGQPQAALPPAPPPATSPPPAAAPAPPPPAPPEKEAAAKPPAREREASAARPSRKPKPEPERPARKPERTAAAPAPKKPAGDPLLDVGGDDDLARELSGDGRKRSVYVPPAMGADLPESVSDSQLNESLISMKASLSACVAEQRAADPSVHGALLLSWSIAPDGSVRSLKNASPEHARQPISACISGVVRAVRFPKTRGGREVERFPFRF
jgi:hypothetical protein